MPTRVLKCVTRFPRAEIEEDETLQGVCIVKNPSEKGPRDQSFDHEIAKTRQRTKDTVAREVPFRRSVPPTPRR